MAYASVLYIKAIALGGVNFNISYRQSSLLYLTLSPGSPAGYGKLAVLNGICIGLIAYPHAQTVVGKILIDIGLIARQSCNVCKSRGQWFLGCSRRYKYCAQHKQAHAQRSG